MVSVLLLSSNSAGLPTMICWNPGRVRLVVLERAFFNTSSVKWFDVQFNFVTGRVGGADHD